MNVKVKKFDEQNYFFFSFKNEFFLLDAKYFDKLTKFSSFNWLLHVLIYVTFA